MTFNLKLSIVIPAYNEEKRIIPTLKKIIHYLSRQDYRYEIIIVDDGSTDKTADVVGNFLHSQNNSCLIRIEKNRGKGYAIKEGVLRAAGQYILFFDADYSTTIEEIEKCYSAFNAGYDMAIGSRKLEHSVVKIHQPFYREFMGSVFRKIATTVLFLPLTDITCGFKCFKKEAAHTIFKKQKLNRWGFDAETLFLASKYDFKIKEIPVTWSNSLNSKVSLGLDAMGSFGDIIKILIYNFRHMY